MTAASPSAVAGQLAATTFKVDDVDKATSPLPQAVSWEKLFTQRCNQTKPESYSPASASWEPLYSRGSNGFLEAINAAYDGHYPLVLSPDAVWMLVAQGFARHVNANAEQLRNLFVEHESKKTLTVIRDSFVKGSTDNPWSEVFAEFSDHIRKHIGPKLHDMLTPSFTTTGPVEKAAVEVVLMDTVKEYFSYKMVTRCGIPEITLEGTAQDWQLLRDRAISLAEFDLEWWISELKPVLDQFVDAASGKPDKSFWSRIYKLNMRSGGPFVQGWVITFFPYLGSTEPIRNTGLGSWRDDQYRGIRTSRFHHGVRAIPFTWQYHGVDLPMHFFAGFMGSSQHQTSLAIRPEIGWAVCDDKDMPSKGSNI